MIKARRKLMGLMLATMAGTSMAADFAGGGTGPIPDGNATGLTVSFNVSGISSGVGRLALKLDLTHTWVGDLEATLRSPGGAAQLVVFGRVGLTPASSFGYNANLGGVYEFSDRAAADLWATAAALTSSETVPPGAYRTSGAGVAGTRRGGCTTWLAGAFAGLTGTQVNGTWTLTIVDRVSTEPGSINSALLSIGEAADDLFSDGFDAPVPGSCQRVRSDYTASGRSSYVLVRNTGGGAGGAVTWYVKNNNGSGAGAEASFVLGDASDFFVDGDIDGDGIADAIVWSPGTTGQYEVRRSSRPGLAPLQVSFGTTGDDPKHIGDYDGDGIDDLAVYRAGTGAGAPSHTLIRLSSTGEVRDLVTGENGAFPNGGIDYTGDGRADMAIQSDAGGGVANIRIFDGTDGALASTFNFGAPNDVMVTGNHFGTAWGDITTIHGVSGDLQWITRDGQTGLGQPAVTLGLSASDYTLSGDFDGDGLDDYAVWRPSSTPGESKFIVRRSGSPATPLEVLMGQSGDYPVENSRTH